MKTKLYAIGILMLLLLSCAVVHIVPVTRGEQPSWPTSWVLADIDPNEAGSYKDYRDIHNAYYYVNNEYLYLRLECYGFPNFTAEPNTRFKWFIDTDDPYNMAWQGGNVYEDEFLLFVEGPQGSIYLLHDVDGNGLIGNDWPDYKNNPGPITDISVAGYRIIDHSIDVYVRQSELGSQQSCYFTWASDQGDPNLDSTSTNDRSDAYWTENLMKADLGVTITDNPDPVYPGESLTYTLHVTNHGPHLATKAMVQNMLPDEVTFISAEPSPDSLTGQTAWWNFTSLSPGTSEVITINVIVNNDAPYGVMTDTSVVFNETRDPLPDNNIATEDTMVCAPPDTEPPSTVTGLTVTDAKDGELNLSWDPATDNVGVDHYEIFRDGMWIINVTGTDYQDSGLVIGQEYVYEVRAVDTSGNKGGFSDPVSGVSTASPDTEPPSKVTGLIVEDAHNGKLNLSWDPATDNVGVDHYRIYRDGIGFVNVIGTSYEDTGLVIGQEYTYKVRAVDAAGNRGGYSDPASGVSTDSEPPSIVTGLIVIDAKDGKLNLSWNPATDNVGVDHYEINRNGSLIVNVTNTFYQDTGLMTNRPYVYEVRAVDAAGNEGGFSDPVTGISTKTTTSSGDNGGGGGSGGGDNNQGSNPPNTGGENNTSEVISGGGYLNALSPPRIDGPIEGYTNITYAFNVSSNNSNMMLQYVILWGDGNRDESSNLESNVVYMTQHQWVYPGTFNISVIETDGHSNATSHTAIIIRTLPAITPAAVPTPTNYLPWFFDFLLILLILLLAYLLIRRALREREAKNKK